MRRSVLSSDVGCALAVGCSEGCDGCSTGVTEASPAGEVDSFFFGCSSMTSSVGGGVQPFPFDSTITSVSGGVQPATFLPLSLSFLVGKHCMSCSRWQCMTANHPYCSASRQDQWSPLPQARRHSLPDLSLMATLRPVPPVWMPSPFDA